LEGIEKEVKEERERLEIIPARLEGIMVRRREKGVVLREIMERRNIGLVEETGKKIGVVKAEREMEVEAIERRIDQWSLIGGGKRETRRMMEQKGMALEGGEKGLVRIGQRMGGERMFLDWIEKRTHWRGVCLSGTFEADGDREEVEGVEERGKLGYCRSGQRNTNFLRPSRLRWRLRSQWTPMCRHARIL
jgi:hypothetical protein